MEGGTVWRTLSKVSHSSTFPALKFGSKSQPKAVIFSQVFSWYEITFKFGIFFITRLDGNF